MYVRCSACGLSRGPPRAAELFIPGIRIRRQPFTQIFGSISIRRQFFQLLYLVIWKNRVCGRDSSKRFSWIYGSIGYVNRILPNIMFQYLEEHPSQRRFFQRLRPSIWKSSPRRGNSSKDYVQAFGSTGLAEAILPKITPQQLEEHASQRRFFQISCPGGWYQQPWAVQMSGELAVVESGVVAVTGEELLVAALFHDIPVIQNENVISAFDR